MNPFKFTRYVSDEAKEGVKQYKYKGSPDSFLYQYLWRPLVKKLVDHFFFHLWIAPNTITLIAYFLVVQSHIIILYHSPDLSQELPVWVLINGGFSVLAYQILDNADGMQARQTGSSSALGMLFDHGCDSSTSWILGMSQFAVLGLGSSPLNLYIMICSTFTTFYTAVWKQYHSGVLTLGRINPIDEGLLLVWGLYFVTAFTGIQFWQQKFIFGLQNNEIVIYGFFSLSIIQFFIYIIDCAKETKHKTFFQIMHNQGVTVLLIATCAVLANYSPFLVTHYFPILIMTLGFAWSKITLHLQIATVCNEVKEYSQFRKSYLFICFGYILNTLSALYTQNHKTLIDEVLFCKIMFIYSLYNYLHTSVCVVLEFSDILGIRPFNIQAQKLKYYEKQKQEKLLNENKNK